MEKFKKEWKGEHTTQKYMGCSETIGPNCFDY